MARLRLRLHGDRLVGLALAVLALAVAPTASAAVSLDPGRHLRDRRTVYALARTADQIYLGGSFSQVGPRTGPWVAISASSGQVERGDAGGLRRARPW